MAIFLLTWQTPPSEKGSFSPSLPPSLPLSLSLSLSLRSSSDNSCLVDMTSSSDYCHDICAIKQSTLILDHNAKTLEKLQNEIVRRTKKDKNGLIGLYRSKYDGCLSRMRQEVKHLAAVSSSDFISVTFFLSLFLSFFFVKITFSFFFPSNFSLFETENQNFVFLPNILH